ncbi:MAG: hypothetical protein NC433_15155 [Clostridiales bacterium]|nr:hypothetical protein [Clostridiales bacterium]
MQDRLNTAWTHMLPLEVRSRSVYKQTNATLRGHSYCYAAVLSSKAKKQAFSLSTGVLQGPQAEAYESMPPNAVESVNG